jgi:hypothetical protein
MGSYSVVNISELLNHQKTCYSVTYVTFSERSQSQMSTYYTILTILHSGKGKTAEIKTNNGCQAL